MHCCAEGLALQCLSLFSAVCFFHFRQSSVLTVRTTQMEPYHACKYTLRNEGTYMYACTYTCTHTHTHTYSHTINQLYTVHTHTHTHTHRFSRYIEGGNNETDVDLDGDYYLLFGTGNSVQGVLNSVCIYTLNYP